jgi:thioredoxin reductase (NADPH)
MMTDRAIDCLVIGGGPAGLTAAIYLTRFHLSVMVIDAGGGRAESIPCTRNHAGYPEGVPGRDLVARMRDQAGRYGAEVRSGRVTALEPGGEGFLARTHHAETIPARAVLLATGVTNHRPPIDDAVHDAALAAGLLRYCPVCDGYEVTDLDVGVIGTGGHGLEEAIFLRGFTDRVTLVSPDPGHALGADKVRRLDEAGIRRHDGPCADLEIVDGKLLVPVAGDTLVFDSVYPALGSVIHSDLATMAGAATADSGCIAVDAHQRTDVPGLYAAGDVVIGLDQISHAMGTAGVAATAIRNDLARRRPLRR